MQVATIPQCFDMGPDRPVEAIHGQVTTIYNPRTGETNGKPWSFQDMVLTDTQGNEIKCTLNNRDPLSLDWKGHSLVIMAVNGKNGWTGLKTKDDTYDNVTKRILWVTGSAIIEGEKPAGTEAPSDELSPGIDSPTNYLPPAQAHQRHPAAPQPTARTQDSQPAQEPQQNEAPEMSPQQKLYFGLDKCGYAMELCLEEAVKVAVNFANRHEGMELTAEHFQAIASTFFIEAARGGMVRELPTKPRRDSK
jgi:hypothetical protein